MRIESLQDRIVAYILVYGSGDWIPLSTVYCAVFREAPGISDGENKRLAMSAIQRLLDEKLAIIGWPKWDGSGGFVEWDGSSEAKIARVEEEWPTNGPEMGQIAWLNLTSHGKAVSIDIDKSGYTGKWPTRFGE